MKFKAEIAQQMEDANLIKSSAGLERFMTRAIWNRIQDEGDQDDRDARNALFEDLTMMFPLEGVPT